MSEYVGNALREQSPEPRPPRCRCERCRRETSDLLVVRDDAGEPRALCVECAAEERR
jgi:hypothetical protein